MPRPLAPVWLAALLLAGAPSVTPAADPAKDLDRLAAANKYPLAHDAERAKTVRADRLAWHRAGTADVFEKGAQAKAAWAPQAKAVLDLYARRLTQIELSGAADAALDALSARSAAEAVAAGCDDPLVRYLVEAPQARAAKPEAKVLARFGDTVAALDKSKYGDARKLYAAHNWLMALAALPLADPLRKDEKAWEARFWELFERVAAEDHPSAAHAVLDLAAVREAFGVGAGRTRKQNHDEAVGHLDKAKAGKVVRLVAEARFLSREGWAARGFGTAATVTPEGRKVYTERLTAAREKLEEAWAAGKGRPEAATDMIKMSKDLSLGRDALETWFARALEANPDNRMACVYKLEALHPKWGGTQDEYLAFGWMCAASENVAGQLPLAALDVHLMQAPVVGPVFAGDPARVGRYYAQPPIWATVQTAAEKLIAASPENVYLRTLYARVATLAGKLDVAHAQFEKLGGKYEPRYFPDAGEYERAAAAAKKAAAKP